MTAEPDRGRYARVPRWMQAILRPLRNLADLERRAASKAQRKHRGLALQPERETVSDRHPPLFAFVRDALAEQAKPRLLSLGCSTGEEPVTLARYLPRAEIDAIDINARSLTRARRLARNNGARQIRFAESGDPLALGGGYDAVFCLSVLRHGDLGTHRPADCAEILPFARIDALLERIDAALVPGGLLVVWGANFRIADSAIAPRYAALEVHGVKQPRGALYGPDNRLMDIDRIDRFVFRKAAA